VGVAVEIDSFAEGRIFFAGFEEVALGGLERDAIALADGFDDGARVNAFVDVKETVGTSKEVCSFLPAQTSWGRGADRIRRFYAWERADRFAGDEADGGLLTRVLPLWSYCSMGVFWIWIPWSLSRCFVSVLGSGHEILPKE